MDAHELEAAFRARNAAMHLKYACIFAGFALVCLGMALWTLYSPSEDTWAPELLALAYAISAALAGAWSYAAARRWRRLRRG